MNTQPRLNDKGLPIVKKPKAYKLSGAEPGHDGERPQFREVKDFVYVEGQRESVKGPKNVNCDRITWLHNQDEISDRQFEAGQRLERDYEQSQLVPVAASTVLVAAGSNDLQGSPNDAQIDASRRYAKAKAAIGSNWAILELVVIDHLSVGKAGVKLRVHRKVAHGFLNAALNQLADHYRIK